MSFLEQLNSSSSFVKSTNAKHIKLIEKQLNDLTELKNKILELQVENSNNLSFKDDCYELQKFCSKLEYLIQFDMRDKKNSFSSSSNNHTNKEYWSMLCDVLKEGRGGFQDAIKYVKNLNEIKTNLGRGRAFIRFCLQYHRLADAVQQLTMDEKVLMQWYFEKSVWLNQKYKDTLIQLLYDLNEINFELISKNNYELDTTWPVVIVQNNNGSSSLIGARSRTHSMTSFMSINPDHGKEQIDSQLLSSTPLEMDNDIFLNSININKSKLYNQKIDDQSLNKTNNNNNNHNNTNLDQNSTELVSQNQSLYYDMSNLEQIMKTTSDSQNDTIMKLTEQLDLLNKQLSSKTNQYNELNACLIKQTSFCESLSELLKKSEQKNSDLNESLSKNIQINENLNKELDILRNELNLKKLEQDKLVKDSLDQCDSVKMLNKMSREQEQTINVLKNDLILLREERENELENINNQIQRSKVALQLKEEETFLLNDQIQKLSKSLDEERKTNESLTNELNECRNYYKNLTNKNKEQIAQLEADNNEIKKRLVKLIKEKADLWQKADNLEYENLLKTNAMWVDDANVSNCMQCSSVFGLLLRKHHCRICLKIYCYYCCNNWIEYNNSKLRVCQKCYETKESLSKLKSEQKTIEAIKAASSNLLANTSSNNSDQNVSLPSEKSDENVIVDKNEDELDDEEDDPDINFEVRAEKLSAAINSKYPSSSSDDNNMHIYEGSMGQMPSLIHTNNNNKINQIEVIEESSSIVNGDLIKEMKIIEDETDKKELLNNDECEQLVERKKVKIIKKKKSISDMDQLACKNSPRSSSLASSSCKNPFLDDQCDQEDFSIVSQEEINKVKNSDTKKKESKKKIQNDQLNYPALKNPFENF